MQTSNDQLEHPESSWVAMTDLFLLLTTLLLVVAVTLGAAVGRERRQVTTLLEQTRVSAAKETLQRIDLADAKLRLQDAESKVSAALALAAAKAALAAKYEELAERLKHSDTSMDLSALERTIAEERTRAASAEQSLDRVHKELDAANASLTQAQTDLSAARDLASASQVALDQAKAEKAAAEARFEAASRKASEDDQRRMDADRIEATVRQELLGMKGKLDRVVFVFDRSASMRYEGRWEASLDTMRQWLDLLPVREAAVVVFNDEITPFPKDSSLLKTTSEHKVQLLATIRNLRPEGGTSTLKALQAAYKYSPIDAVILFTDGEPDKGTTASTRQFAVDVKQRFPETRIHTVGIGDYFRKPELGEFLLGIAHDTGGVFVGR